MRAIEIIRSHEWERAYQFPEREKRFRCKRCGILLEIRTLTDKRWWGAYKHWGSALAKNAYLLVDPIHGPFISGIYSSREDISKDYSCSRRLMRMALR